MRILTEAEYERRLEQARMKGYEDAANQFHKDQRANDFREDIWRAVRESRQDFDRQIMALREALRNAGIKDPTEPQIICDGGVTTARLADCSTTADRIAAHGPTVNELA